MLKKKKIEINKNDLIITIVVLVLSIIIGFIIGFYLFNKIYTVS